MEQSRAENKPKSYRDLEYEESVGIWYVVSGVFQILEAKQNKSKK